MRSSRCRSTSSRRSAATRRSRATWRGSEMAIEARPVGFFTDTSICIGCKACEVACKEWNQLGGDAPKFTADSYDNTGQLDSQNWRHVQFIETLPSAASDVNGGKAAGGAAI